MLFRKPAVQELTPAEVQERLRRDEITLIDVREPQEFAAESLRGAHLVPLSTLDPGALPRPQGRPVVFHCVTGRRSAAADARCAQTGVAAAAHMKGGLVAWKAAGLPTVAGGTAAPRR